jgi:hypothetical protein
MLELPPSDESTPAARHVSRWKLIATPTEMIKNQAIGRTPLARINI